MRFEAGLIAALAACVLFPGQPSFAGDPVAAYRVLDGPAVCLPCGGPSYFVIDSQDRVNDLHAALKERCGEARSPETWRKSVTDLGIDFDIEAIVAMYEVIGTAGQPSLELTGPQEGVLRAAIAWHTGPPPHVPVATAACMTFAVRKSAVDTVTITSGGVLHKAQEELSLEVSGRQHNQSLKPTNPAQGSR